MVRLPELLTECYLYNQPWQEFYMSRVDAIGYFEQMIERGNIIAVVEEEKLLGYVEFWRINFEQFGRIICRAPFWTHDEDTTQGNICYLANIWISPDFRRGLVLKQMELEFFNRNNYCEYYAGFAGRKATKPVKVFKRENLKSSLFTGAIL